MKNLATMFAVPATLASMLVGCINDESFVDDGGHLAKYASDPYGPVPSFRPSTCQDIADRVAGAQDGEYTLYIQNEPTYRWKAYCADMATTPVEYLTVAHGVGLNTSSYASGGKSVVTSWEKLRVNPRSLAVDLGDTRFATSSGTVVHNGTTLTQMPYGVAMSCSGTPATANINLSDTRFRLEQPLSQFGTTVKQTYDFSADRQNLNVTVTGDCGWVAQRGAVDPISDKEQFELRLAFFLPAP